MGLGFCEWSNFDQSHRNAMSSLKLLEQAFRCDCRVMTTFGYSPPSWTLVPNVQDDVDDDPLIL